MFLKMFFHAIHSQTKTHTHSCTFNSHNTCTLLLVHSIVQNVCIQNAYFKHNNIYKCISGLFYRLAITQYITLYLCIMKFGLLVKYVIWDLRVCPFSANVPLPSRVVQSFQLVHSQRDWHISKTIMKIEKNYLLKNTLVKNKTYYLAFMLKSTYFITQAA